MAEINTSGLEELSYAFLRQETEAAGTVEEMLNEQANVYVEEEKKAAQSYGIKKTGKFIASIKAGQIKREDTEAYIIVAPIGKASHGADYGGGKSQKRKGNKSNSKVRYAAIGAIYEYGTSSIPAKPWLTKGNTLAKDKSTVKVKEIWDAYINRCFS